MKKIFSANDVTEAQLVKGMLEQQGIATEMEGYYLQGAFGELPVIDMISLYVDDAEVNRAQLVVNEYMENSSAIDEAELTHQALQYSVDEE